MVNPDLPPILPDQNGLPASVDPSTVGAGEFGVDLSLKYDSPYDHLSPFHIAVGDMVAKRTNGVAAVNQSMQLATQGVTIEQQDAAKRAAAQEAKATELANATAAMTPEQFQQFLAQIGGNQSAPQALAAARRAPIPAMPQEVPLEGPNQTQAIVAALAALLQPRFAADIAAAPFQAQLAERERRQGLENQRYQNETQQREAAIREADMEDKAGERALTRQQRLEFKLADLKQRATRDTWNRLVRLPPAARVLVARNELGITDTETLEALGTLTLREQVDEQRVQDLKLDNSLAQAVNPFKEKAERFNADYAGQRVEVAKATVAEKNEKILTERALRGPKVAALIAQAARSRAGKLKDEAATRRLEQQMASHAKFYDDEYALRIAERKESLIGKQLDNTKKRRTNAELQAKASKGGLTPDDMKALKDEYNVAKGLRSAALAQWKMMQEYGETDQERIEAIRQDIQQSQQRMDFIADVMENNREIVIGLTDPRRQGPPNDQGGKPGAPLKGDIGKGDPNKGKGGGEVRPAAPGGMRPDIAAARREGLALIKRDPSKAAAVRKRFRDVYGQEIGG